MSLSAVLLGFIYFRNSCTRNGDHLSPFVRTGNGRHKERMLSQTLSITFKKCEGGEVEIQ